ncbi:MAG: hypothetical protein Q9M16_10505 [Mariprofundus sp.]|nr:hypothetical protein [Mariprofundus sp.]
MADQWQLPGWARDAANVVRGGIDGLLSGTDGGGVKSSVTKNETVLLDQSQKDKRTGLPSGKGMSNQTMLMIGGGLFLVAVLVMVKK